MFCRKCGKENPNDAKFCASCGIDLHPTQVAAAQPNMQQPQPQYAGGAAVVPQKSNSKTIIIVVAALAVLGLIAFLLFNNVNKDPLYGTWYVKLSQFTDRPATVNFTKNTITFGAHAIGNTNPVTVSYDKVDSNTLKIYPEGDKPFECHCIMSDDNLYLTCSSESSLNLALTKGEIKVPVNN